MCGRWESGLVLDNVVKAAALDFLLWLRWKTDLQLRQESRSDTNFLIFPWSYAFFQAEMLTILGKILLLLDNSLYIYTTRWRLSLASLQKMRFWYSILKTVLLAYDGPIRAWPGAFDVKRGLESSRFNSTHDTVVSECRSPLPTIQNRRKSLLVWDPWSSKGASNAEASKLNRIAVSFGVVVGR